MPPDLQSQSPQASDADGQAPSGFELYRAQHRQALNAAFDGLNGNPDDAGRAMEFEKSTGHDPVLINNDLENYEKQYKAQLVSEMFQRNKYLGEYASSDPMHAKVSADDWGQLDATSGALIKLRRGTILGEAFKAGKEAYGEQPLGIKFSPSDWEAINSDQGYKLLASVMELVGQPADAFMRSISAFTAAGAKAAGESWAQFTGDEGAGRRLEKAIGETVELGMMHGMAVHGPSAPGELQTLAKKASQAVEAAAPYIKAGVEPPAGIHPIIDKLKVEQTRNDLKILDEVLAESDKSATRERSQEAFASYIRAHPSFEFYVSADAVRRLYGDKEPSPEDGILGWVPGIVSDLRAAEVSGGDIKISHADWLANIDKEVAKALKDDTKVRSGGLTVNEGKELGEHKALRSEEEEAKPEGPPEIAEWKDWMRQNLGREPTIAEEVDQIKRRIRQLSYDRAQNTNKEEVKSEAYVDVRNQLKHLRQRLNEIGPLQSLRDHAALNPISETLQGKWEKLSKFTEVFRPTEKWNEVEQGIVDDVTAEVKRIAPKANMRVFGGIREPGSERKISGSWEPHPGDRVNIQPLIALSIHAGDITKTARHEAMHDLWERGFWSNEEKASLVKAAHEEGWIEEHGIERRYKGADQYGKLKEAIADHFGEWRSSKIEPISLAGKALQKLQNLIDSIKAILQKHGIGEATWEELFERADRGAVGRRAEGTPTGMALRTEPPEHIVGAGYKIGDQIFQGSIHAIAKEEAMKALGLSKESELIDKQTGSNFSERHEAHEQSSQGFVTSTGRFVDRKEADEIARKQDQIKLEAKGRLGGVNAEDLKPLRSEPELPGTRRLEDTALFEKASTIGMTVPQYKKYLKLIEQRTADDLEFQHTQAEKEARKRLTKEWKERENEVRKKARADVEARPDIAVDEFFRQGYLYGDKLSSIPKLATDAVGDEHRAGLPDRYLRSSGIHPDDVAGLFGYQSGRDMLDRLVELQKDRGEAQPAEFMKWLIDEETERRMRKEFGDLDERVLEEAKEHVISPTQIDLIHEEVFALAAQNDMKISLSKDDIKVAARNDFDNAKADQHSVDKYLALSGKAGRAAEMALLSDKPVEAFKYKQQQYKNLLYAKFAGELEKAEDHIEGYAKRFSSQIVASIEQEYTNFIRDILARVGEMRDQHLESISNEIAEGAHKNLLEFATYKNGPLHGGAIEIADFLLDPNFRKPLDQLTAAETIALRDTIKSLVKNGGDEKKVLVFGEVLERADVKADLISKLESLGEKGDGREYNPKPTKKIGDFFRYVHTGLLQLEQVWNRFDRGDPHGMFNKIFTYPAAEAGNNFRLSTRAVSKQLEKLPKIDFNEKLGEGPINNPETGQRFNLNTENLITIMLNMGTERAKKSNFYKMTQGWGVDPVTLKNWVFANAKQEHWDFVQGMWKIMADLNRQREGMERHLSGVAKPSLPIGYIDVIIDGKQQRIKGGYYPIIRDERFEGKIDPPDDLPWVRPTTPQGYLKERTGDVRPISMNMGAIGSRISQTLRDIHFRPFVKEASKMFYDKEFRSAMTRFYGKNYTDMLEPFLRDIAMTPIEYSKARAKMEDSLEFVRGNTVSTLIGFNIGTIQKHGLSALVNSIGEVGLKAYSIESAKLANEIIHGNLDSWHFPDEKSAEIAGRSHNWRETFGGAMDTVSFREGGFTRARAKMIDWGSKPVAFFDLISAKTSWLVEYRKQMELDPTNEEAAIALADRAVRRAHGSTALTARPEFLRGGAMGRTLTSLYGYFNQMYQRNYETAWRAKDLVENVKEGDRQKSMDNAKGMAMLITTGVLFPALVHEMISSYQGSEKDSLLTRIGKSLVEQVAATVPIAREIVSSFINGRQPSVGMLGTEYEDLHKFVNDISKKEKLLNGTNAGKIAKDFNNLVGIGTGLTNSEIGKLLEGMINVSKGAEKPPQSPKEAGRLLTTGSSGRHGPMDWMLPGKARENRR